MGYFHHSVACPLGRRPPKSRFPATQRLTTDFITACGLSTSRIHLKTNEPCLHSARESLNKRPKGDGPWSGLPFLPPPLAISIGSSGENREIALWACALRSRRSSESKTVATIRPTRGEAGPQRHNCRGFQVEVEDARLQ